MAITIGHASISENGTKNGSPGDSTGKEVCLRAWYKPIGGWDFMAIHPDANVREKHAVAIESACWNNNIGYGQKDRNTLHQQAKLVNYDLSKVGKCNCDCSSLQNVAAVASGAKNVTYGVNGWTTSTMKQALSAAGYKIIMGIYANDEKYCVRGAIYVKSGSHTVCGLENGNKYQETLRFAGLLTESTPSTNVDFVKDVQRAIGAKVDGIPGSETLSKTITVSKKINSKHAVVRPIQKRLNALGYNCGTVDGVAGPKFDVAVKLFQKDYGCFSDGEITKGQKTWKILLGMI